MRKNILSSLMLVAVLLLAACNPSKEVQFTVDNTKPVSTENRIIYQMNIGAFTPEGTFKAAQEQLGRLETLGADILWLMPTYPRGATKMSPYASMNFREVNPAYGTIDDLKAFVAAAHEHGMKVWLDWVPNHVAVENPWVKTHPEYFTKDAKGKMINPHGWNDVFQLNYQDKGLVNEMNSTLKFWIDSCDVDGYRCDYVTSPTIPVRYWQDIIAELKSQGKAIEFLSETDISDPNSRRIDSCGFDYDYAWGFQGRLAYQFGAKGTQADSLQAICQQFLDASKAIKNKRMVYLTNHDQNYNDGGHTLRDFYGDNRYALSVLQFTLYGMPLIYQGQEIGDPDTLNYFTDAKVKWDQVDTKMLNTVRSLIALHHTETALSAASPVEFLTTGNPSMMAYQRGNIVVVLNFGETDQQATLSSLEKGNYDVCLNSRTIAEGPALTQTSLSGTTPIELEAKGYAIYRKK